MMNLSSFVEVKSFQVVNNLFFKEIFNTKYHPFERSWRHHKPIIIILIHVFTFFFNCKKNLIFFFILRLLNREKSE